jgi:hypothetical protein
MQHDRHKRDLFRRLECPLHLVHRVDAPCLLDVDQVQRRRNMPTPLRIRIQRLMQRRRHLVRAEPLRNLAHRRTIRVVEVMPRREDLNRPRAAAPHGVEQPSV